MHSGNWNSIKEGLIGDSDGHSQALITTGDPDFSNYEITIQIDPKHGFDHYLVFNVFGNMYYHALGFCNGGIKLYEKNINEKMLAFIPYKWNFHKKYILKTTIKDGIIKAVINGFDLNIENAYINCSSGVFGFLLKEGSKSQIDWLELACPI